MKDLPDIIRLMEMNASDAREEDIKEMFIKYDVMDLYEKVIKAMGKRNEKEN